MKKHYFFIFVTIVIFLISCSNPGSTIVIKQSNSGYNPANGDIVLNPENSFANRVTESGKTYIIRDGFDLKNETVSIASGSTLYFLGGSISNGTINFNSTKIEGYAKFINCSYSGNFSNDTVEIEWFDVSLKSKEGQLHSIPGSSTLKFPYSDSTKIQQIINCCKTGTKIIVDKQYVLSAPIKINKKISFEGLDNNEGIYSTLLGNFQYGFATTAYNSGFVIENGGEISLSGITVLGNINLWIGQFTWEKEYSTGAKLTKPIEFCGLDVQQGGKINTVINSSFTGFTYGIRSIGGSIGLIRNSYCSDCRYGFWAKNTNSFECRGCRFNTNKLNFNFFKYDADYQSATAQQAGLWKPILEDNGERMYRVGGGVYLENCQNVQINKCRFEFNFIHAMVIGSGKDVTFDGCIYDTATISQVLIHNDGAAVSSPAMNNITFTNSTFARGARCDVNGEQSRKGYGILYITDKENRGSKINFTSNIISDNMEVDQSINVEYEKYVFCINNTSTAGTNLIIRNNSFTSAEAEYMYHSIDSSSGSYNIEEKGNDYGQVRLLSDANNIFNFTLRTNGDINENYK